MINKAEVVRRFNCSINTVNKYLSIQKNKKSPKTYSSKLDEFKGIVIEKVDDYSASGRAIFNFIKDKGFSGSYGTVAKFIREHKKEEKNKATMRFETTPGFQAQVDWKENFKIINKEGKVECVAKLMDRLRVYNKEFTTIEELEEIVNKLMKEINNEDINFVEKPISKLKGEQRYLNSLPSIECVSQYFPKIKAIKFRRNP